MAAFDLYRAVLAEVREHRLIPCGSRGIVAFSGGPDSLCLLHVLARMRDERSCSLAAVHVDHGLRPESAVEAEQARQRAQALGVQCNVLRATELTNSANVQERARRARRRLLAQEATRLAAAWIALGHTANDQAETVVMRMLRGAGPRGLSAMARRTDPWIRPLLTIDRAEIEVYLTRHGLRPLRDPSNANSRYLRTRVRHELLPLLQRENINLIHTLCRLADNCQEEAEALDQLADAIVNVPDSPGEHAVPWIALEDVRGQPKGLRHRVLTGAYERATGSCRRLARIHIERLQRLVEGAEGSEMIDLPGARAMRSYDRLVIMPAVGGMPRPAPARVERLVEAILHGPGIFDLGEGRVIEAQQVPSSGSLDELPLDRVRWPVFVRGPKRGERIAIGGGGHKRVSRVLIDAKVPVQGRASTVVVAQGSEVLLIPGLRRAAGWAPALGEPALRFVVRPHRLAARGAGSDRHPTPG